ncbi:ribokinase [Bacillus sp. ISL-7]|uniref:ribokinase n=1 Tax=Bacillus sp. ISL-7 TaxID=2819136 RepID=UPI001BE56055|nr:ribokinase [Bacillus sp. ISL-7]MBT2733528.1 ribokinase [Bacillus sp. ISL-7]
MSGGFVTVVGSLNFDIIFKQKKLPAIGETYSADNISFCSGGKGANQAVQCAKLGLKTYLVGKIGEDYFGEVLKQNLSKYGVDTTYITTVPTNTGIGVVNSIEDGSLVATIAKGANYSLTQKDIDQAETIIANSKVVILQLEVPIEVVEYTIKKAKKYNCYVILNGAPASEISEEALKMVDCFVVNESEASYYAGKEVSSYQEAEKACELLHAKVGQHLIITLGAEGSLIFNGTEKLFIPPNKVKVVETTGAGDSYIGAFAYGKINGMDLREAGNFASKVSSLTVLNIGGQDAMPTIDEVKSSSFV